MLRPIEDLYKTLDAVSRERLGRLAARLSHGGVIPYVGAGMSLFAGYPSWHGLCDEVKAEATATGRPLPPSDILTFSELLQYYSEHGNWLEEFIESRFRLAATPADLGMAPISHLPALGPPFVVTTNYDSLLEQVFGDSLEDVYTGWLIDPRQYHNLFSASSSSATCVLLKLHGSSDLKHGLVATDRQYAEAYRKPGHNRQLLAHLMTAKSLLFLGCSLDAQDGPTQVLSELKRRLGHFAQEHFALRAAPADISAEETRLNKLNVRPIWYRGSHDESLRGILKALGNPEVSQRAETGVLKNELISLGESEPLSVLAWLLSVEIDGSTLKSSWKSFVSRISEKGLTNDLLIRNGDGKRTLEVTCKLGDLGEAGKKQGSLSRIHPSLSLMYRPPVHDFKREYIKYVEVAYDVASEELRALVNHELVAACRLK